MNDVTVSAPLQGEKVSAQQIKEIIGSARSLDEEASKRLFSYAPWCHGTFRTSTGTFTFALYHNRRGILTLPTGERGLFNYDIHSSLSTDDARHITAGQLLSSATELSIALKGVRSDRYLFSVKGYFPGTQLTFAGQDLRGVHVDGQLCDIVCGIGFCSLIRKTVSRSPTKEERGEKDLRTVKRLVTDDFGEIRIMKRSVPMKLGAFIKKLRDFSLSLEPDADVTIRMG